MRFLKFRVGSPPPPLVSDPPPLVTCHLASADARFCHSGGVCTSLPPYVTVRRLIESLAPPVCTQHPCGTEIHEIAGGEAEVDATNHSVAAVAPLEAATGEVCGRSQRLLAICPTTDRQRITFSIFVLGILLYILYIIFAQILEIKEIETPN